MLTHHRRLGVPPCRAGAGSGYRVMQSGTVAATELIYGGRYTSVTSGVSVAGVAATGQMVTSQARSSYEHTIHLLQASSSLCDSPRVCE